MLHLLYAVGIKIKTLLLFAQLAVHLPVKNVLFLLLTEDISALIVLEPNMKPYLMKPGK